MDEDDETEEFQPQIVDIDLGLSAFVIINFFQDVNSHSKIISSSIIYVIYLYRQMLASIFTRRKVHQRKNRKRLNHPTKLSKMLRKRLVKHWRKSLLLHRFAKPAKSCGLRNSTGSLVATTTLLLGAAIGNKMSCL